MGHRKAVGKSAMARITLWACAVLLAVTVVAASDESLSQDKLAGMSKEELLKVVTKQQTESASDKAALKELRSQYDSVKSKLDQASQAEVDLEKKRLAKEKSSKEAEKKKEADQKAAKLKEKTKLSDLLMERGAEFLAMRAAKDSQDSGSTKQKAAVMKAAKKGARAGAVGPLKKVARSAAVEAVKTARADAKKAGKKNKHEVRKLATAAAKEAVAQLLQKQDKLVDDVSKKWFKAAIKKYPPSVYLDDEDDKPNVFTAPPSIHLTMDDSQATGQVQEMKEDASEEKKADADTVVPEK